MADTLYNGILLPDFAQFDGYKIDLNEPFVADDKLSSDEAAAFIADKLAGDFSVGSLAVAVAKHCSPIEKAVMEANMPEVLRTKFTDEEIAKMALEQSEKLHPYTKDGLLEGISAIQMQLRNPESSLNGHLSDGALLGEAALLAQEDITDTGIIATVTKAQIAGLAPLLDDTHTQLNEALQLWNADQTSRLPQGIDVPTGDQVCTTLQTFLKNSNDSVPKL